MRFDKKRGRSQNDRNYSSENKFKRQNNFDYKSQSYQNNAQLSRSYSQKSGRKNMSYEPQARNTNRSSSSSSSSLNDQQFNRESQFYERRLLYELMDQNKKQNKHFNSMPQQRQNENKVERDIFRERKNICTVQTERSQTQKRNEQIQGKGQIKQPFYDTSDHRNQKHFTHDKQHTLRKKDQNNFIENKIPFQRDILHVEDQKVGIFIVDELGTKFVKEESDGAYIKDRIFVNENKTSRAIHSSRVIFKIIQSNQKGNNKTIIEYEHQKPKCKKAQILEVIKYPENLDNLVGFFGEFSRLPEKPEIDFGIKNKSFNYQNKELFYFYPLDNRYPKMILKLKNAQHLYPGGELFKKYFRVKFLEWPEEYTEYGPLIEILEPLGYLYDEVSDIQALFYSYNCNFEQIQSEELYIQKAIEQYKHFINNKNDYQLYQNEKIFTVDQIGAFAFDDAISIEKISHLEFENQKQKHFSLYKNSLSQNSQGYCQEITKMIEDQNQINPCKQSYYKIGVHITDFSMCIEKGTVFFQGLENRKQSIYLEVSEGKQFVKHMLHRDLIDQFSMKKGELRLAKSIFFCVAIDEFNELKVEWDSLTIENTKIIIQQNYFYNEFDHLCNIDKEIYSLYKEEFDSDLKYSNQILNGFNEKTLIITQEEAQVLLKVGAHLFKLREEKGQKAFQSDKTKTSKRFISSKMIEELMVLYNQSISRYLHILHHINSKQGDIKNNINFLSVQLEKNISLIKKNKALLSQSLYNLQRKYLLTKNNILYFEILELQKSDNFKNFTLNISDSISQSQIDSVNIFMPKDNKQGDELDELDYMKSHSVANNKNQLLFKSESESFINSCNLLEIITESGENEEEEEELVNPFTIKKDYLIQKVEEIKILIQKLQKEIDTIILQQSNIGQNNKIKISYLKQVDYFKNQCLQVGFYNFKYSTLQEFQASISLLKNDTSLNPIMKKYLLHKKQQILNDLQLYFQICQKETNQVQKLYLQVQQSKDQIAKLLRDQISTQENINKIQVQEIQFNLQKQQDSKKSILKSIKIQNDIKDEKRDDFTINDLTLPQNQLLSKQEQNYLNFEECYSIEQKYQSQKDIMLQDLNLYQNEINCLNEQIQELDQQIETLKEDFKQQEIQCQIRVQNDAYELYKLLDIAPGSDKYVSATSPLRKFNDLIVQKFLNLYFQDKQNIEFQKEYSYLIFQKQQNTKQKNEIKKFKEKIEKLKTARNMLFKGFLEGKTIQKKETVLQVNHIQGFEEGDCYIFFLPDEIQSTRFISKTRSQIHSKNFTLWDGTIVAHNHLPYNIYLASVSTKEQDKDVFITLNQK
ncbi:RNB-like protein (macronuclear) [Tetrahymena thermophila SB210]|uniref:RNB-like protein n=1 Tax=Tetrahymena thermophila (strain SB210) TaxID=312017 RepID=I7LUJ7_TETTS|nr:RNB-like protein [Tetrahymena thermophila SB210]EAR94126.1 RNB-like protein [Tetrahymena thermophila SB210]|eukprot:XP_001014371.1 RNB-like protein [Tetrahymena thermophila SB210]